MASDINNRQHAAPIIVIGRQFGSGGHLLGKALADKLGVKFYDRELLTEAANRFGLNASLLSKADEKKPSMLRGILEGGNAWVMGGLDSGSLGADGIYAVQSRTIELLAREGGAVIVGRTADYVLRDYPALVSIFLHAPERVRAKRIVDRGECDNLEQALDKARKIDRLREGYYNYFTGRQWGKADNYHLSLSTGEASPEKYVDFVISYIRSRFEIIDNVIKQ